MVGKFPMMGFEPCAFMSLHSLQLLTVLLANILPLKGQNLSLNVLSNSCGPTCKSVL